MKLNQFPRDLMVEILLRLPIKSLCRFKCVSKSLFVLITDPYFVKLHRTAQRQTLTPVFSAKNLYSVKFNNNMDNTIVSVASVKLPNPFDQLRCKPDRIVLVGSCDGLLCIVDPYVSYESKHGCLRSRSPQGFIYNPATREYKPIPSDSISICKSTYFTVTRGFGYIESTDDYMFVKVYFLNGKNNFVNIFSMRNNAWENIIDDTTKFDDWESDVGYDNDDDDDNYNVVARDGTGSSVNHSGIYLNGSIHWVIYNNKEGRSKYLISAFDLVEKRFRILCGGIRNNGSSTYSLSAMKDSLCLIRFTPTIKFWVMKKELYPVPGLKKSWKEILISRPLFNFVMVWKNDSSCNKVISLGWDYTSPDSKLVFLHSNEKEDKDGTSIGLEALPGVLARQPDMCKNMCLYEESLVSPISSEDSIITSPTTFQGLWRLTNMFRKFNIPLCSGGFSA